MTKQQLFTPGPWEVLGQPRQAPNTFAVQTVTDEKGFPETICELGHQPNARLIAAAPELLKQLKRSNSEFKELHDYIKRWWPDDIRLTGIQMQIEWNNEAIAKARGRI